MIAELDEITLETMRNLEVTRKEFWNISKESGLMFHNIILEHNFKNALEIGTSNGYSGLWISKALKQTGGRLTTIEYFDERQSVAVENFNNLTTILTRAYNILTSSDLDYYTDYEIGNGTCKRSCQVQCQATCQNSCQGYSSCHNQKCGTH